MRLPHDHDLLLKLYVGVGLATLDPEGYAHPVEITEQNRATIFAALVVRIRAIVGPGPTGEWVDNEARGVIRQHEIAWAMNALLEKQKAAAEKGPRQ